MDERVHDLLKDVSIAPPRGRVTARAAAQGHGEGPRYKAIKGIEINGRRIPWHNNKAVIHFSFKALGIKSWFNIVRLWSKKWQPEWVPVCVHKAMCLSPL